MTVSRSQGIVSLLVVHVAISSSSCPTCTFFDTSAPIVKRAEPSSYFGFSVAQHSTISDDGDKVNWLLVGAPLGGNNSTGKVWRCPITTFDDDCIELHVDGDIVAERLSPGQWFGGTVRNHLSPGKILVCSHRYLDKNYFAPGLCYTFNGNFKFEDLWNPCSSQISRNTFEYGFCQFGTSGMFADNDTVIVGSPGQAIWRGLAFSYSVDNNITARDNHLYRTANFDMQAYSYEGMAVTARDLFGNGTVYITGAPRGKGNYGTVRLYLKVQKPAPQVSSLDRIMSLVGTQFGSQFGYELATADIDGNGYPDLLVGAPNYFDTNKGGAVYIYINNESAIDSKFVQMLTGSTESRFGISIANIGDLNKDGCDDIAVGSPYSEGAGMVYIYSGSENGILSLVQVISGKNFGLSYFGYSLSSGLDMDENNSHDLLVGDYESSTILLFRSRMIYEIKTSVNKEKLTNIDLNHKNCSFREHLVSCFLVELCFEINTSWYVEVLNVTYQLEADTERQVKRVWLDNYLRNDLQNTIMLSDVEPPIAKKCVAHTAFIKDHWRHVRTPVNFRISYIWKNISTNFNKGDVLPSLDEFPGFQPNYEFKAIFLGDCKGDVCYSQLAVIVNIINLRLEDSLWILKLEHDKEIKLEIFIENEGESAYSTLVFIQHNPLITFTRQVTKHDCSVISNKLLSCLITDDPLENMKSANITLRFSTTELIPLGIIDGFNITWNTTSKFDGGGPINMKIQASRSIGHPIIKGIGEPNEVRITSNTEIEMPVKFMFEVGGNDNWPLKNVMLHVYLPSKIVSGDLGFTNMSKTEGITNQNFICSTPKPVNSNSNENKLKTDVHHDELMCGENALDNCHETVCSINNLENNNVFRVTFETKLISKAWEQFMNMNITIRTYAKIFINISDMETLKEGANTAEGTITVKVRPSEDPDTKPLWPYFAIGSVIAIIILSMIIFICCKIGFFKRYKVPISPEGTEGESILKQEETDDK